MKFKQRILQEQSEKHNVVTQVSINDWRDTNECVPANRSKLPQGPAFHTVKDRFVQHFSSTASGSGSSLNDSTRKYYSCNTVMSDTS